MHIVPSQKHFLSPQTGRKHTKAFTVSFFFPLSSQSVVVFHSSTFYSRDFPVFHTELGIFQIGKNPKL